MRICKYCKKPISDNDVWNPDQEGNGYHHVCLCEIEFRLRDRQIYDKGRADILDKIRAEIDAIETHGQIDERTLFVRGAEEVKKMALNIIDKYRNEVSE